MKNKNLTVNGEEIIIKNMNKTIKKIQGNTFAGIRAAVAYIRDGAKEKAPVDEGILRGSAFADSNFNNGNPVGVAGFTAKYSAWVHEAVGKLKGRPRTGKNSKGFYWDGGEPKFLSKFVLRNMPTILNIIRRFASKTPS